MANSSETFIVENAGRGVVERYLEDLPYAMENFLSDYTWHSHVQIERIRNLNKLLTQAYGKCRFYVKCPKVDGNATMRIDNPDGTWDYWWNDYYFATETQAVEAKLRFSNLGA